VPVALWADAQEVSALQNLHRLWCCLRLRVDTCSTKSIGGTS
jgi:hypothetical protein